MARFFEVKPGNKCRGGRVKKCGNVRGVYRCFCYLKGDIRRRRKGK